MRSCGDDTVLLLLMVMNQQMRLPGSAAVMVEGGVKQPANYVLI